MNIAVVSSTIIGGPTTETLVWAYEKKKGYRLWLEGLGFVTVKITSLEFFGWYVYFQGHMFGDVPFHAEYIPSTHMGVLMRR